MPIRFEEEAKEEVRCIDTDKARSERFRTHDSGMHVTDGEEERIRMADHSRSPDLGTDVWDGALISNLLLVTVYLEANRPWDVSNQLSRAAKYLRKNLGF